MRGEKPCPGKGGGLHLKTVTHTTCNPHFPLTSIANHWWPGVVATAGMSADWLYCQHAVPADNVLLIRNAPLSQCQGCRLSFSSGRVCSAFKQEVRRPYHDECITELDTHSTLIYVCLPGQSLRVAKSQIKPAKGIC